ncbi:DUF928 domain-containing protein [Coleofasciculus sp. FACHB-T130]|uniref:DUF928 domain-containing protein n=1 Tax=Cyanophyceae TaxID=3028117 RepID=UPI001687CD68|nr:DUF928 domain-containing protein [Coleofasciculus sp. FACHB-T130]MBD1881945.1 DUF928 domain-containing protein [Coleofasciculus sp. FACHB-T130]
MDWMKSPRLKRALAISMEVALLTGFSTLIGTPPTLLAQGMPDRWIVAGYNPPKTVGAPGRREGGGTRSPGSCPAAGKPLTALIPANNIGFTVAAYPSFSFYVPPVPAQASPLVLEFVLKDEKNDREIYTTTFMTMGKGGIVSISLPTYAGLPPLEVGKNYQWFLSMVCDSEQRSLDVFVQGSIQRVPQTAQLDNQLRVATPNKRPDVYAEAGMWFDALTTLAELRRSNPNNSAYSAEWEQLLKAVGLDNIAKEPLLPSMTTSASQTTPFQRLRENQ